MVRMTRRDKTGNEYMRGSSVEVGQLSRKVQGSKLQRFRLEDRRGVG